MNNGSNIISMASVKTLIQGAWKKFTGWRKRGFQNLTENGKLIGQAIVTLFFIILGIWFLAHEQTELVNVKHSLGASRWPWIMLGMGVTLLYIALQAQMYVASFCSVGSKISFRDAVVLFLKRNFISVFIPAGGVSSLAFFNQEIEKKGVNKNQIYAASVIYGFVGILSVVIVAVPIFLFAIADRSLGAGEWAGLISLLLLILLLFYLYRSLVTQNRLFRWVVKTFPAAEVLFEEFEISNVSKKQFLLTVFYSFVIELTGIIHLFIAMSALGFAPSWVAAMTAYVVSVIFLIVSPFLRGFGAIEVSMAFILIRYGYSHVEAVAATFLYRFFEFWLPLLAGLTTFMLRINKLLMRVVPAILLFALGIVNIISVLTPAISERVAWLKEFIPTGIISVSNYFVFVLGLFLLVTASFMLKGLKSTWWFALFLSIISAVGNLTKAGDYEEALVAVGVVAVLIATRKDYYVKNNPGLRTFGIRTAVLSMLAVLMYGVAGFYFLDKKHFDIDFNLWQSVQYTLQNYFFYTSPDLVATNKFARDFILSINLSGFATISFLTYTLIRPYIFKEGATAVKPERTNQLMEKYGQSALDYFKTYPDKIIFGQENLEAFIGYRVSGNFAVVLENPVAANVEEMTKCLKLFDKFCFNAGMKSIFYRVPEASLPVYKALGKKSLFIGQEGIVDLNSFSIEGKARKSIRNAVSKISAGGYKATVHHPPVKDGLLQKVKSVSDEWLNSTGRSEIVFSQGMFAWQELKQQTLITVENDEEKIIAFLNIIPDYANGEATYDLIRKTADAPNGIMDFILVEMFNYLRKQGYSSVNMGFAPLSGIDDPHNFPEKSMKFAYEKIRGFAHYKGLREYKEKFVSSWGNRYLIYEHDYDLLQIPMALSKVIKP